MQFSEQLFRFHRFGLGVLLARTVADHTRCEMIGQKLNPERIESRTNSRDLVQNIDAVTLLLDHSLDAGDLARYALDPGSQFVCVGVFDAVQYTPTGYMSRAISPASPRISKIYLDVAQDASSKSATHDNTYEKIH